MWQTFVCFFPYLSCFIFCLPGDQSFSKKAKFSKKLTFISYLNVLNEWSFELKLENYPIFQSTVELKSCCAITACMVVGLAA